MRYNNAMSHIEISQSNFLHNLNQIVLKTQSVEKVALVLKDNAYGHGLDIIARLAHTAGVKEAVVRNLAEARRISHLFDRILVLNDRPSTTPSERFSFAVNDLAALRSMPKGTPVELKIDTGMHRHGIRPEHIEEALETIAARSLKLIGVMSHYRGADEMGSDFFWQRKNFDRCCENIEKLGISGWRRHSCNSAALFRLERFDEDIARVGIAAYGCLRLPQPFDRPDLKPVMRLFADRLSSRRVTPSMGIGYGGEGRVSTATTVSTYDIGYGDGWLRGDARNPYRLPDGRAMIGRVSMDMFSLEGDDERVSLFDDAAEAARQFGTIAYDILVKLSPEIPRVLV